MEAYRIPAQRWAFALTAGLLLGVLGGAAQAQPFEVRTYLAGFGGLTGTNGVAVADYNRDGHLDVYFVVPDAYDAADTRTWSRLFAGLGGGRFMDRTRRAGVAGRAATGLESTAGNGDKLGAAWGDYDGDGWPDLYLTHAGPNQLYRNNGDGTFTDVTDAAGVAGGAEHLSTSALWFDPDRDGDLDLYVSVWEDYAADAGPSRRANPFFENLGDGTFRERTAARGLGDRGQTYTALPLDVNDDGWPDLYAANDFGVNRLYLNDGTGAFQEATDAFGLADRGHGMGLALGDPNGDGRLDVYLTNISNSGDERHALFVANADGGYAEQAEAAGVAVAGWGWGTAFFDLENDGDEDLFVGAGYFEPTDANALFENRSAPGELRFTNVAPAHGVADLAPARGLAVADLDGDGRLDLLVANRTGAPFFYRNTASAGAWLQVALDGGASNRDALGARVVVQASGRTWVRAHHGAQFLGQSLLPVHVGLGDAAQVEAVTVMWPSGQVDRIGPVAVNQAIRIREGVGLIQGRPTATEQPDGSHLRVSPPYPNPFATLIRFPVEVASPGFVALMITNVLGQTVRVLRAAVDAGGSQTIGWDGRDEAGRSVAPGVYVYTFVTDGAVPGRTSGRVVYLGS